MAFGFDPLAAPTLRIAGSDEPFRVRRIYCVGRNYADHAREMGHDPDREPPFFFSKPADAFVHAGEPVPYPPQTADLHYEAELVVAIGTDGRAIERDRALDHVFGYAIGNDLTRRDLQAEAKSKGRPWDLAKGFDGCAVFGPLHPAAETGHLSKGAIRLSVDGTVRQDGDLSQMIWPVADVVAFLSRSVALKAGDLIMTGTPSGVGALKVGDRCVVAIEGLGEIETPIVEPLG